MWLTQNKCKNEHKFLCAIKCGSQLGCLGTMYQCSVIRNNEGREGQPASVEFSRLFLSRSMIGSVVI